MLNRVSVLVVCLTISACAAGELGRSWIPPADQSVVQYICPASVFDWDGETKKLYMTTSCMPKTERDFFAYGLYDKPIELATYVSNVRLDPDNSHCFIVPAKENYRARVCVFLDVEPMRVLMDSDTLIVGGMSAGSRNLPLCKVAEKSSRWAFCPGSSILRTL